MTNPNLALTWDSAETDNPGDQAADSALGGYYSIGPEHPKGWSLTLVLFGRSGQAVQEIPLGILDTEGAAKSAAQAHESEHVPLSPSGLTADDDCDDSCVVHASNCDGYCDHGMGDVPHRNACLPDMSAEGKNSNCLDGIRCPRCGAEESFRITATAVVQVFDDGTNDATDIEWNSSSRIECTDCPHCGTVAEFTIAPAAATAN